MSENISARIKKHLRSSFAIPLTGYPIACKLNNVTLFTELLPDKAILVFGNYELFFCCQKVKSGKSLFYETTAVHRTFCEIIPLSGPEIEELLAKDMQIKTWFSAPLEARISNFRPEGLKVWDRLKKVFSNSTWVGVLLEGELTAKISLTAQKPSRSGHYSTCSADKLPEPAEKPSMVLEEKEPAMASKKEEMVEVSGDTGAGEEKRSP